MKGAMPVLCLLFLTISQLSGQHAPWENTAGPPGVEVRVIYEANSIVYAGTETQGVYKSTDNGLNWITANHGIERPSVRANNDWQDDPAQAALITAASLAPTNNLESGIA